MQIPINKYLTALICVLVLNLTACVSNHAVLTHDTRTPVAIWNIDDFSIDKGQSGNVGELLASSVMEAFSQNSRFSVVERQKLLLALEELNIGSSELADKTSRLKIGRMVGARLMVFGGYQIIAEDMRLDLRLVDVESGKIIKTATQFVHSHDIDKWLDAARKAAIKLTEVP